MKSQINFKIFVKSISIILCLLMNLGILIYVYSDIKFYDSSLGYFSNWQLPLFVVIIFMLIFGSLYLLYKKKFGFYILFSIVFCFLWMIIPYQNYGDFYKLRLLSFCNGDGRLCKEYVYPHITQEWCISKGYSFDKKSRFCKLRAD